jgi:hypothetical protein
MKSKMKLDEILYHIGVEKDLSYLNELIFNNEVHSVVVSSSKRHKCNVGLLNDYVKEYVIKFYEYSESDYLKERFINSLTKFLGRKARGKK